MISLNCYQIFFIFKFPQSSFQLIDLLVGVGSFFGFNSASQKLNTSKEKIRKSVQHSMGHNILNQSIFVQYRATCIVRTVAFGNNKCPIQTDFCFDYLESQNLKLRKS